MLAPLFLQKEKGTKENVLNGFSTPSNFFLSADAIRDTLLSLFILGALITRSNIILPNSHQNIKSFVLIFYILELRNFIRSLFGFNSPLDLLF